MEAGRVELPPASAIDMPSMDEAGFAAHAAAVNRRGHRLAPRMAATGMTRAGRL
jgi:hypothetical protein